jgi:hypothetical protein
MGLSGLSGLSGLRGVVPGGAMIPWLPTMEPSLRLWIDPSDTTGWTLDDSGNPTAIRSKASTQDVFSLVAGTAPVLSGGALSIADTLTLFESTSLLGFAADPSMLFTISATASANLNTGLIQWGATTNSDRLILVVSGANYIWRRGGTLGTAQFGSVGQAPTILSAVRLPGVSRSGDFFRANGVPASGGTFADGGTNQASGTTRLFSGSWLGSVGNILAFSDASQALYERAEGFIAHKEGRTGQLPANHPFKSSPPMVPQPSGVTDPDAASYIAAVGAADGQALEPAIQAAINDFVIGCKSDPSPFPGVSNFGAIKASCVMMGARTLAGALVPLRGPAPTNFNFVAGDYSRGSGLLGDGVNKYLNSNQSASSTPSLNFSLTVGVSVAAPSTGTHMYIGGQVNSPNDLYRAGSNINSRSRGNGYLNSTLAAATGFIGNSITSQGLVTRVNQQNFIVGAPSSVADNTPVGVFCRLISSSPNSFATARLYHYSIGEAVDLAALDARVTTLRNAIAAAIA